MKDKGMERRDFLKSVLAAIPALALEWNVFPRGDDKAPAGDAWDAVIVGAGLAGLSCAAAFARQGFKALVLEQHSVAGGYATSFRRRGGFVFDASLHSMSVGERNGLHNLIPGFPEIENIEFLPHKVLYRAIFPNHDIRVPSGDPEAYLKILTALFPDETEGIRKLFGAMSGLAGDIGKYSRAGDNVEMTTFPQEYPYLFQSYSRTWGEFQDQYLKDVKLKALVSSLWGYFGLPPSKLASLYYAMPVWGYLSQGGYYPRGRSQTLSDALVAFIAKRGGKVLLGAGVDKILLDGRTAIGVRLDDGREFRGRVVVANANVPDVFGKMIGQADFLEEYRARLDTLPVSISAFQVFLGLKKNLVKAAGLAESEIFCESGYDPEAAYQSALKAEVEKGGFGLTAYDNIFPEYSPPGKNTLSIISLQGFDHWQPYAADYLAGRKTAYRAEKERLADILIGQVEQKLLPDLRQAIEVKEIATPLTNLRYTRNVRGAVYGFDQTVANSGGRRLAQRTPVKNLYLAGAWTRPGHGYGAVIPSGLMCFAAIMEDWKKQPG